MYESINSPRCPALWFVCILIIVKEEWVLVQLGSQHKFVERLVRPVFPDYPFLVTMVSIIKEVSSLSFFTSIMNKQSFLKTFLRFPMCNFHIVTYKVLPVLTYKFNFICNSPLYWNKFKFFHPV